MFFEEIRYDISFCPLRILYNSIFIIMATSLGTNVVVVTRFTVFRNVLKQANGLYQVFVCVEVLRPSQPNGVMSSAVSLPNHTFTGQA